MFPYLYLLKLNFLQQVPQWIEAIALIGSGVVGAWIWWRNQEQKRLSSIENVQNKILIGYDNLLDELRLAREEREKKIDELETTINDLQKRLTKSEGLCQKKDAVIEGLKTSILLLQDAQSAPDDVREYLLKNSVVGKYLKSNQNINLILKQIETIPDRPSQTDS